MKIEASNFKRLIEIWKTKGNIYTENQVLKLIRADLYELIPDGNYILHEADVIMGKGKSETFEIVSLGDKADKATLQYFNSKSESEIMTSEVTENDFPIPGIDCSDKMNKLR